MFVIPCRFDPDRPIVFECVYRLRQHHPHADILVVDSDSPDPSYAETLRPLGIQVDLAANRHYEVGALWHAYEHHRRDHYYLLQDAAVVKGNLDDLARHDVSGMMYANDWLGCEPCHIDWAREHLAKSDYPFLESGFRMIFGNMLFAKREVLTRLRAKNFDRVLPSDKVGSCAMERLLGIALQHEGYGDVIPRTFLSDWVGVTDEANGRKLTRTPRLDKVWLGRA
jgi:hypothetical protein